MGLNCRSTKILSFDIYYSMFFVKKNGTSVVVCSLASFISPMFLHSINSFAQAMLSLIVRRSSLTVSRPWVTLVRPLSLSPVQHDFSQLRQMMDALSKNPQAIALVQAIRKDPKILQSVQELMSLMAKKGFIDLTNPSKQPSNGSTIAFHSP